jgi:NAD-dependent deacetylase
VRPGRGPPRADPIDSVVPLLRATRSALFVTGAGLGADSGLPTYRGIGGLYERADTDEGVPIEEALSGAMLRARPEVCWKYVRQIEAACRGASPNAGHRAIAALEARLERVWVLTQNVDGLHQAAGSRQVIEIHGNVHTLDCTACTWSAEVLDYAALPPVPTCPRCDRLVRPRVVLFGEALPEAAVETLQRELRRGFDLVFSVGTTSVFPYIAAPVLDARRRGRPAVEINPGLTEVSEVVSHRLALGAADALSALVEALDAAPP